MTGRKRSQLGETAWHAETAMVAALWDGLAAQWAAESPARYPDGAPYPAATHLANLARLGSYLASLQLPDGEEWMDRVTLLMRMVRDADEHGPLAEQMRALVDTRAFLVRRGRSADVRCLAGAAAAVNRYYAQSVAG